MPSNTRTTKISETFDRLKNQIKSFNKEIRSAESVARSFDAALRIDPSNLTVANEKFKSLSEALANAQSRLKASREQIEELNNAWADRKGTEEYKIKLKELTDQTKRYEAEVVRLSAAVDKAGRDIEAATPKVKSFGDRLKENIKNADLFKDAVQTAKRVVVAMVAAVVKLTKEMSELGKELVSNAKKYDTTVEKLQEQSYLFHALTGDADAYTKSLQALNSVTAQILSGRGQSQLESLSQIGLKKSDISGKSTAEAYEIIFEALRNVDDQAKATAVAVKLFGDAGAYVAEMANASDEEFNKYLNNFREVGGLSEEAAEKLATLSNDMYLLKYQIQIATADLIRNLAPTIKTVLNLLSKLAGGISLLFEKTPALIAMITIVASVITIKMIPSLIKLIVQTALATTATWAHTAAVIALIGAMTLGVGSIIGLGVAIGSADSATKNATSDMDRYTDSINSATQAAKEYEKVASRLSSDVSYSTETIENTSNTSKSEITITIKAEGNSDISDKNAKTVGEITVDQINKALGGIVS